MAFTVNQLNAIEAALASGQLEVEYDGRRVKYRSVDELIKARGIVRGALIADGLLTDTTKTNRGPATLAVFSRD